MAARVAAIRWRNRQIVVVIDVAACTGHIGVAVCQRETRRAVVEDDVGPARRAVALGAVRDRERGARLRVWRVVCLLPSGQMAAGVAAVCGCNLQIVIVIDVAARARDVGVTSRQREAGGAVVELGTQPTVETVATLAIAGRKRWARARVWRVRRTLPILQMAGIALR